MKLYITLLLAFSCWIQVTTAAKGIAKFDGCYPLNVNKFTLVFRQLDYTTLDALNAGGSRRKATFFLKPEWIPRNVHLISDAVSQGHTIGLALTTPASLVDWEKPKVCSHYYGGCGQPVFLDSLERWVRSANATWGKYLKNVKVPPRLVALTTVPAAVQLESYNELMIDLKDYGLNVVLASFGVDSKVDLETGRVLFSNTVENVEYFDNVGNATAVAEFYKKRAASAGNLESVKNVWKAVEFLEKRRGIQNVPMAQCVPDSLL
ncbi:hypothetical protein BDR26DRAFT_866654, partial [Obelidium mucronatum]